ncbi:hypothetical protein HDV02_006190 [Globomyces sp. JEL0801]|nr:hypothetical protein HDV02_006190 [Globomyces sp. JEL0801]
MSTTDDPEVELANSLQLWDYIQSLVSIAFDSNHTPSTKEFLLLQTYISDLNIRALYLLKLDNGYLISLDPILKAGPALAFIKRFATLVKSMPFHDQLLMYAISPFFDSTQLNDDKDAKNGLNLAKKKLAELELSLVHLQQNVAIPDIHLRFHPQIEQLIAASVKLGEKPSSIDFSNLLDDSKFLNEIQKDVNIWIKEIQKVTHLTRDPASGSTRQEIEFWIYMEKSLALIENQLKSPEIILTLDILRAAKRFQATVSFMADTGIKEATEKVVKYNQLMKDFPINELLSATDFEKTKESLDQIFVHFNKKLRLSPYPISRALLLAEAISRDLNAQILKIFHGKKMLHIPYTEFVQITQSCQQVFETWEEQVKEFMSVAREVARKRAEKFLPIKVTSFHIALQERIEFIYSFRKQHEQLVKTIDKVIGTEREGGQVLGISDFGASKEVDSALDFIKSIDILDLSNDGVEALAAAETTYNDQVFQVEQQIIVRLRDRLGTAKNASDMFRVFSKFNALFVRPTIRGAIHEYQSQLIERVKDDIRKLHEKFMLKYSNSEALQFTQVRDVPPVSGSIIWAKGIEQQLNKYMKKVEYVLGKGWEQYAEGQKLQQEELSFKRQLDTLPIFQAWVQEETNREFVGGRIFSLTRNRLRGNQLELGINFDSKSISVFKEVRNLLWLGFAVPIQLQNIAKDSKRVYPFAVSLNETLRIYHKTLNIISENKSTQILTAGYHQAIQSLIARGIQLRWDYFINTYETRSMAGSENRHVVFVRELASAVSKFQEKLATAVQYTEQVELLIEEIAVIPYQRTSFEACLGKIQKNIDQLNFESFSNLDHWAFDVDKRIRAKLLERLQKALKATQLDSKDVQEAYAIVDQMFNKVSDYVEQWLKYQALWDLELEKVYESLGSDLDLWSKTLIEVKKARSTFDTTRTMENFGPIVIEYGNVQTKVNAQYDIWQRDLISRFGTMLGNDMRTFYNTLNTVRKTLESTNVTSKTKETVNFILLLQDLKIKSIEYESNVTLFQNCQRVLERQRYHFGPEWLYIDQIKGEWSSFKEILSKKNKVVDEQLGMLVFINNYVAALKLKIIDEDKVVNGEAENLVAEWAQQKPIQGDISPENALIILQDFESKFTNIDDSLKLLEKAKLALSINTVSVNGISAAMEELKDLQEVWNALSEIWIKLEHIKKIVWLSDECSTVRKRLEGIIMQLKEMPNRLRQYLSFQSLQKSVTQYVSIHIRALPLQSGTLRDRHWSRLLNTLGISTALSSLQVGQIWDGLQVQSVQNQIDEIISLANGELALETYLKQAKLHWENYSLEFVNYQNKCRLVRGWDELFTKCLEHLGALNAMKNSIHFKAFKNEANGLEELLSNLYLLLDNWVKVQRQWVYLQAIFSGNQEIKQILPLETSRFTSIDTEFMTMLRKIYKSPLVYDVINIPNILQSMQRLGELLAEIQKSLGEYLERERARFARFYFIADEDLLEILGNTKDLTRIQPHFKKMFPAINRVLVDEESNIIGIASKEGEQIAFSSPVSRSPDVKIHEWLSELEVKTKEALFSNLIEACNSVQSDYLNKQIEIYGLIEWMGSYPSQVILLAAQCKWTTAVEDALKLPNGLPTLLVKILDFLKLLAQMILKDLDVIPRKKCESLIAELVHQRDVVRTMIDENVSTNDDFRWLCNMRFYLEEDILRVDIANATFIYGFEYLGIYDRLIQTPLTDRCYLTLSLALNNRLGGSPYGPAGTGKLGLGAVLVSAVFFHGLDEFNRLEENILSAVSQQIQSIQLGLQHRKDIEIIDSFTSVHPNTGFYVVTKTQ